MDHTQPNEQPTSTEDSQRRVDLQTDVLSGATTTEEITADHSSTPAPSAEGGHAPHIGTYGTDQDDELPNNGGLG